MGGRRHGSDVSPDSPLPGERPNDLLVRLFALLPAQLTASYRPHVAPNPEATADFNLRYVKDQYPHLLRGRGSGSGSSSSNVKQRRGSCVLKVRATEQVVGAVLYLGKKAHVTHLFTS